MAQLVEPLTLDLGSGHDLRVHEFEPRTGLCTDRVEPAGDSLCVLPPLVLFLKANKLKTFFKFCFLMFISETETEHEWGRVRERGGHRI